MIDAKEYGKALFLLAEEEGIADTVRDDVLCVRELTLMHPEYLRLLDTPALTKAERLGSIDESMATVHAYLRSAIKMLSEKHRARALPELLESFLAADDSARGIERAEVVSAVPLTKEELDRLASRLGAKTGKTIILKNTVDTNVLGGVKLRYMGIQLDSTLRTALDAIEQSIKSTIV